MISKTSKNRFAYKLDKLFWFLIMLLPLILYGFYVFGSTRTTGMTNYTYTYDSSGNVTDIIEDKTVIYNDSSAVKTLVEFMQGHGLVLANFSIYGALDSLFGDSGTLPLFDSTYGSDIFMYITYCVNIEIIHVFFDVIVFIPRLAHKWVGKAVQDD